jgi:nucleolar protein 9
MDFRKYLTEIERVMNDVERKERERRQVLRKRQERNDDGKDKSDNNDDDDDEDVEIDLQNVLRTAFGEVQGNEFKLALDRECSKLIEKIVVKLPPQYSVDFVMALDAQRGDDRQGMPFLRLSCNPFGSRLLETLLSRISGMLPHCALNNEENNSGGEKAAGDADKNIKAVGVDEVCSLLARICDEFESTRGYAELFYHQMAAGVLRTLVCVMGGVRVVQSTSERRRRRDVGAAMQMVIDGVDDVEALAGDAGRPVGVVPDELASRLRAMWHAVWPDMSDRDVVAEVEREDRPSLMDVCTAQSASPTLQVLIEVLAMRDALPIGLDEALAQCVAAASEDERGRTLAAPFSPVGSRLIEKMLTVAKRLRDDSLMHSIYLRAFRGRIAEFATAAYANFAVQRLLEYVPEPPLLQMIYDELAPVLGELSRENRAGVLSQLAGACARLDCRQKQVVRDIAAAFEMPLSSVDSCRELVLAIMHMGPVPEHFSSIGCRLLGNTLHIDGRFTRNIVNAMLAVEPQRLVRLADDQSGSHVIDAMLGSAVDAKKRFAFVDCFRGFYADLAISKFGSRSVDSLYAAADVARKTTITEELHLRRADIAQSFNGKFVLRNCKVYQFERQRSQWTEEHESNAKKRELFDDILNFDVTSAKSEPKGKSKGKSKASPSSPKYAKELELLVGSASKSTKKRSKSESKSSDGERKKSRKQSRKEQEEEPVEKKQRKSKTLKDDDSSSKKKKRVKDDDASSKKKKHSSSSSSSKKKRSRSSSNADKDVESSKKRSRRK